MVVLLSLTRWISPCLTCHPKHHWVAGLEAPGLEEKVKHVGVICPVELQWHTHSWRVTGMGHASITK